VFHGIPMLFWWFSHFSNKFNFNYVVWRFYVSLENYAYRKLYV